MPTRASCCADAAVVPPPVDPRSQAPVRNGGPALPNDRSLRPCWPALSYRTRSPRELAAVACAAPARLSVSAAVAWASSARTSCRASPVVRPAHPFASQPGHSPRSMKTREAGCRASPRARLPIVISRPQLVRRRACRLSAPVPAGCPGLITHLLVVAWQSLFRGARGRSEPARFLGDQPGGELAQGAADPVKREASRRGDCLRRRGSLDRLEDRPAGGGEGAVG